MDNKREVVPGLTAKDKAKFSLLILGLGVIILIAMWAKNDIEKHESNKGKLQVIKSNNEENIIEFSETFEYNPDYSDFFEVEDELEVGVEQKVSKGEVEIRRQLGSLLDRAHPNLVQAKAAQANYNILKDDSNPNKGQIFWVVGKVISIDIGLRDDEIQSAQFINKYLIETEKGGLFELQTIRSSKYIRVGDVVFMNGVYLKLTQIKNKETPVAIMLGNSLQEVLPLPAVWESKKSYENHLNVISEKNKKLIQFPKELDTSFWKSIFEKELEMNENAWSKINDKTELESQKLVPELETLIISDLSKTSNRTLLDLVDYNFDAKKPNEENRRKIIKVVGKLKTISEAYLDKPINGLDKVYYCKVEDLRGNFYYFNYLKPFFIDQSTREAWKDSSQDEVDQDQLIPKEGDIVVCTGIFVQTVMEGENRTPLVYGKFLADIGNYDAIWNSVDHGKKRLMKNGVTFEDYEEAGMVERMPLAYLLSKITYTNSKKMISDFFAKPEAKRLNHYNMMSESEKCTDQIFVRYGKMMLVKKIEGTYFYDFHGVKDVYEIYFRDIDFNLYTIICPNLPAGAEIGKNMTFTGYFLKRFAFRNKDSNVTWTPYLIGYIDSVEVIVPKKMSNLDKAICVLLSVLTIAFIYFLNKQYFRKNSKINPMLSENIHLAKERGEILRKLTEKDKKLEEIIVSYFHHSLIEELPIPLELCHKIDHWVVTEPGIPNLLLRPDYIKSEFEAIIRHYIEFSSEPPKDIKSGFFNKRKELLNLRTFQNSKFEVSEVERKRTDCLLIVPLSFIKNRPENLDRMDGYLDEYGLPPWNTWVKIGKIPKFVLRHPNADYTPETLVIVCHLPIWMAEKAKSKFMVLEKLPKQKELKDEPNDGESKT